MILLTLNYNNQCSSCVLYGVFDTMHEVDICKLKVCETLWGTFSDAQSNLESGYYFEMYITDDDYFSKFIDTHSDEMDETNFIILFNSEQNDTDKYKSKKEAMRRLKTLGRFV
jgi:hypothetical protein